MSQNIWLVFVLVLAGRCQAAQQVQHFASTGGQLQEIVAMKKTTTTTEEENCPVGWVTAVNEGCFTFLRDETKLTWIEANLACEQAGGYLAEPQSLEQMEFLAGIAGLEADFTGIRNWWIGLTDFSHEGTWIWTHSNQEVNQVFWGEGSPENSPGNSLDCAFLALQEDNQLVWKDMDCSDQNADGKKKIAPLCQRGDLQPDGSTTTTAILPTTTTQAPATTTSAGVSECPEGWSKNETSCYWVVFDPVDWIEANDGCPQIHPAAHLASSGSELENDYIAHLHYDPDNRNYFWLGGTDSDEEGNWTWTDGTPFTFTKWYTSEGSDGTTENCLAIDQYRGYQSNGRWYDFECYVSYPYVCEIDLE